MPIVCCQCYHDPSQVTDELVETILRPGLEPGAADIFLEFICYSGGPLPEELLPQVKVSSSRARFNKPIQSSAPNDTDWSTGEPTGSSGLGPRYYFISGSRRIPARKSCPGFDTWINLQCLSQSSLWGGV